MHYKLTDIPAMLATPVGRMQLEEAALYRLWPLSSRWARMYRARVVADTRVVAVVGSFGKSTTTRAVTAALGLSPHPQMLLNAYTSVAKAVMRIPRGARHAAIEVGISAPGQMAPYARVVRPDIVVVTGIGTEHARSLGTLEGTRTEKSAMVRALAPSGVAVMNGDDANVMWMRTQTAARAVTYGFDESCDVRASDMALDWPRGMRFAVHAFGQRRDVAAALIGRHMVYPLLAAIAVARVEGVALDDALARLATLPPTVARMQPVPLPGGVIVLRDDYKSTVETIHAALDALAAIPARRIVVLGDVAEPQGNQHLLYREIGARVATMAAHLVTVGRGHDRYSIGARRAGMPAAAIHDGGRSPHQGAAVLAPLLQPGDVVLVKGRDTQMLDRVRLILAGRDVRCRLEVCTLRRMDCEGCPMLERGWDGRRFVS